MRRPGLAEFEGAYYAGSPTSTNFNISASVSMNDNIRMALYDTPGHYLELFCTV